MKRERADSTTNVVDEAAPLLTKSAAKGKKDESFRQIYVCNAEKNKKFKGNSIHTTKYNFITLIPKNLWEQFHRVANIYFLLVAALQLIPTLSPTGQYTTILPLICVMGLSMLKDTIEDLKRRRSDRKINNSKTRTFNKTKFESKPWKQVKVGDIVKIKDEESFPADLLLISSSLHSGMCFVETSSLDGETNLKIKRAIPATKHMKKEELDTLSNATIECEKPNKHLYKFEGRITIDNQEAISLDIENLLLRGSSLRNTGHVFGIVIFTGHEAKLMQNMSASPHKISQVERKTNRFIFFILALLIGFCLLCTIGIIIWHVVAGPEWWYLHYDESVEGRSAAAAAWLGFKSFWTFFILFNNLIPISLFVSMEFSKYAQGYLIGKDLAMYHEESDTPARVQNSALNEELGQVSVIFSDKTGTLTCNKMELIKVSIAGEMYGSMPDESQKNDAKFTDDKITNGAWKNEQNADDIRKFFTLLAVCHTVIPETKKDKIHYQASSPDEAALVKAARAVGFEFISRSSDNVKIKIGEEEEEWKVLNVLDFTSNRKRQSVIVRGPDGKLLLMTKGADSVVYPLLKEENNTEQIAVKHIEEFARDGLRTLVCAQTELDEGTYKEWNKQFKEAKIALEDRQDKIEKVSAEIEKDLELIGITAIEDKLQDGVPDTISDLLTAGIKLWVLTGDKQETAINIGFSCALLDNGMELVIVEGSTAEAIEQSLQQGQEKIDRALDAKRTSGTFSDDEWESESPQTPKTPKHNENINSPEEQKKRLRYGLVIEGKSMQVILDDETDHLKQTFLELAMNSQSLICCRASPKQKADVVQLVRTWAVQRIVTLAIGDGANDVSMIQTAHVGIGISGGEEGQQAANSADYSIGQFRFLSRLLLVHGRWNYRRISKLVLYSFYKNIVLYLTQFWFVAAFNSFSGESLHDNWAISFYNLLFTALPIMVLAILDRDVNADIIHDYPELYAQGHRNMFFNLKIFVAWTITAIYHSAVCFFVPVFLLYMNMFFKSGQDVDLDTTGITIYTSLLIVVTIKCLFETSSITWVNVLSVVISLASWIGFVFIYGSMFRWVRVYQFPINETYNILDQWFIFFEPVFYLAVFLTCSLCLLHNFAYKAWVRNRRNLYTFVVRKGKKLSRDEILNELSLDDTVPVTHIQIKKKKPKPKKRNIFSRIRHRGYAFSISEDIDTNVLFEKDDIPN